MNKYTIFILVLIFIVMVLGITAGIVWILTRSTKESTENKGDTEEIHEENANELTSPTITLYVADDLTGAEDDGICTYIVSAAVTGNPEPELHFSRNDSLGYTEWNEAIISLHEGEEYKLRVIAENSEGTAQEDILLEAKCAKTSEDEGSDDETDTGTGSGPVEFGEAVDEGPWRESFPLVTSMSGTVSSNGSISSLIYMGDDYLNHTAKAYLTFDISGLSDAHVLEASVNILDLSKRGDPTFAARVDIKKFDYGTLDSSDFAVGGTLIHRMPTSPLENMSFRPEALSTTLQESIDAGDDYYQIKIGLSSSTDNDNNADGVRIINLEDVYLSVLYE